MTEKRVSGAVSGNTGQEETETVSRVLPRDAMLAQYLLSCVCLFVCLSVTRRYCIKTAKLRSTKTTSHDSQENL